MKEQLKPQENNLENFNNWIKPDISKEGGEFERVIATFYGKNLTDEQDLMFELKKIYEKSSILNLEKDLWEKLENIDSKDEDMQEGDWGKIEKLAAKSRRDWRMIKNGYESNKEMECPIIAELPNGVFHLVSGNTRLCTAKVANIQPKVIIMKFPDEGFKPFQENRQLILKKDFLSGRISSEDFRDEIFNLDQEGTHTENAEENIKLLEDKEIVEKVQNLSIEDPEILESYYLLLALSYFHKGQGINDGESFSKAEEILRDIEKNDWYYYVLGTKLYFEKNLEELKVALMEIENKQDVNYKILEKLVSSLENGDNPKDSYQKVYSNSLTPKT